MHQHADPWLCRVQLVVSQGRGYPENPTGLSHDNKLSLKEKNLHLTGAWVGQQGFLSCCWRAYNDSYHNFLYNITAVCYRCEQRTWKKIYIHIKIMKTPGRRRPSRVMPSLSVFSSERTSNTHYAPCCDVIWHCDVMAAHHVMLWHHRVTSDDVLCHDSEFI